MKFSEFKLLQKTPHKIMILLFSAIMLVGVLVWFAFAEE